MTSSDLQDLDDGLLMRYLLGALPEQEAEHLHELSIVNQEFAERLDAVENDLVDAYVRGELSGDNLKQFQTFYLSSPLRREKVRFAEGLAALENRTPAVPARVKPEVRVPILAPGKKTTMQSQGRGPRVPAFLRWGFADASLVVLVLGGYVFLQNQQLRKEMNEIETQRASVDRRALELETQLNQEKAEVAEVRKELEQVREAHMNLDQVRTISFLLPPPMRGAAPIPTISLRPGTDLVVLVLTLESDDFPAYQAKLKDPGNNRTLWSSTTLTAAPGGERKAVSISFRASLLQPQNYVVDLTGIPGHGTPEIIGGYAFHVVLK